MTEVTFICVYTCMYRVVSSATGESYFPLYLLHVLTSPLQGELDGYFVSFC